jgi:protein disulfide-isomerase
MKILSTLFLMCFAMAVHAADRPTPYNESADARQDIKQALATATNKPIIIVFGANWCPDCLMLDNAMKHGTTASLLHQDFNIVKVDVGHFDKNQDVAESYGVPLKKGIPAVAIISSKSKVLYVTKEGELASARKLGDDGIYKFFKGVTSEKLKQ